MGGSLGQLYGAHLFTLVPGVINCEYHQDYGDGFSYIGPYICICVLVAKMGIMISIELKLRVEEFIWEGQTVGSSPSGLLLRLFTLMHLHGGCTCNDQCRSGSGKILEGLRVLFGCSASGNGVVVETRPSRRREYEAGGVFLEGHTV